MGHEHQSPGKRPPFAEMKIPTFYMLKNVDIVRLPGFKKCKQLITFFPDNQAAFIPLCHRAAMMSINEPHRYTQWYVPSLPWTHTVVYRTLHSGTLLSDTFVEDTFIKTTPCGGELWWLGNVWVCHYMLGIMFSREVVKWTPTGWCNDDDASHNGPGGFLAF